MSPYKRSISRQTKVAAEAVVRENLAPWSILRATQSHSLIEFFLGLFFKFSRQMAEGRLLCPDHKDGTITFEQYLAEKYG